MAAIRKNHVTKIDKLLSKTRALILEIESRETSYSEDKVLGELWDAREALNNALQFAL